MFSVWLSQGKGPQGSLEMETIESQEKKLHKAETSESKDSKKRPVNSCSRFF
jgi:hypothetical protein